MSPKSELNRLSGSQALAAKFLRPSQIFACGGANLFLLLPTGICLISSEMKVLN